MYSPGSNLSMYPRLPFILTGFSMRSTKACNAVEVDLIITGALEKCCEYMVPGRAVESELKVTLPPPP